MFRYFNHRFHWKNFSFQIPDGFYLDCDPEPSGGNTMWLQSPNFDFYISIDIQIDSEGTQEALRDVIIDMMPECVAPIRPVSVNGLCGHHASYRLIRPRYYELFLDLGGGELLNIVIWSSNDSVYDQTAAAIAALDLRKEPEC